MEEYKKMEFRVENESFNESVQNKPCGEAFFSGKDDCWKVTMYRLEDLCEFVEKYGAVKVDKKNGSIRIEILKEI